MVVPDRGDIIEMDFDESQAGHEQAGRRPALVLSPKSYNNKSGRVLACPITSQIKNYPFEVAVPKAPGKVGGVALVDQIRALDYRARNTKRLGTAPDWVLARSWEKLRPLLDPGP